MRSLLVAFVLLAVAAPAAQAGKPITPRPECPDMYVTYSKADAGRYRDAVLCLISAIRKDQKLNALHADAKLRKAGQRWADHLGKTGATSHGKSYAEIPKRIAKAGYKASAVNEGLGIYSADGRPYDLVGAMMTDFACTEILDPRFRDAGVGVNLGKLSGFGRGVHVVVEFGLKRTAKPPRSNRKPASTCGHRLPRPQSSPLAPVGSAPEVHASDIAVTLRCVAKQACTFDATLTLAHNGATSKQHVDALAAGDTRRIVFDFDADDIAAERAHSGSAVDLRLHSTAPYDFDDLITATI